MTDLTPLFTAVIGFIAALLAAFLIPLLHQLTDAEDLSRLLSLTKMGVSAAEQLFPRDAGGEKRNYVVEFLQGYDLNVDEQQISMAIESAVLSLHRQLEGNDDAV